MTPIAKRATIWVSLVLAVSLWGIGLVGSGAYLWLAVTCCVMIVAMWTYALFGKV